uniref:Uncharacterized protein n=1 Tax=Caenorhabditis tropicalis TaxID=1561998 RepID=A0A1I7TPY9_9PELO
MTLPRSPIDLNERRKCKYANHIILRLGEKVDRELSSDIEKTCTEETNIISKRRKKSKKSPNFQSENPEPDGNFERLPTTSSSDSSRPVIIVVAGESVNKVIAKIQRSLGDGTVLEFDSAEAGTQVQMPPYVEDDMVPMYNNNTSTTSFATQYEDPGATFCERGTMMNDQEFNHFSPPYGAEFGDIPPQPKDQQQFGYSVASTSTQPQTRNFGTMFEDVHKCNTGTSMIDEPYGSEFLRDIETQTPSYLIQDSSSTSSGGSSTAPSTSQNDWRWPS